MARSSTVPAGYEDLGSYDSQGHVAGTGDTVAAAPAAPAAPAASQDPNTVAQQLYPQYAWALNDPELGPIFRAAAASDPPWDAARLQGALYATNWWKNNSTTARAAFLLQQTDPATYKQNTSQMSAHITDLATQEGVQMGPAWAPFSDALAAQAISLGWTDADIKRAIANQPGIGFSIASPDAQNIKTLFADYGIPMRPDDLNNWTHDLASGRQTTDNLRGWLIETAKGRYPGISQKLDEGMTVAQIWGPFQQQAATDLGVSPDSIDINDPKYNRALNQPTKDGGVQMMTLYDWAKLYKTDPVYQYDKSPQARGTAAQFISGLEQTFGRVG